MWTPANPRAVGSAPMDTARSQPHRGVPAAGDGLESPGLGHRLVADDVVPAWLRPLVSQIHGAALPDWVLHATDAPQGGFRRGAVLMLLADGTDDGAGGAAVAGAAVPDLLLTRRSMTLRFHAGQPAFPGGALDPGEDDVGAALREAAEETGLDPTGVDPLALLPQLYLPPSQFLVRPVLGHWRRPVPVRAVDVAETAQVVRVPVTRLADPANRGSVVIPRGGVRGLRRKLRTPAFDVGGFTVWGFTAGLVDLLLEWGGWAQPWDRDRVLVPESLRGPAA